MNVSDVIVDTLYTHGIDTYFVVNGGSIVPFINSISNHPNTRYICCQHEQAASMAVEGYYRSSGKIAGVCVTSGPGVQNILNGVSGCWYDSIPAFFITGQVSTKEDLNTIRSKPRQLGFQEMPVCNIFENVTKMVTHISSIESIETELSRLISCIKTPRYGPVLLDLPVNIQMSKMERPLNIHLDIEKFDYIPVDISPYLYESKRPLLIYGHGVKLSESSDLAIQFANKMAIPFIVTWGAFDICNTEHPLRFGSPGVYGNRVANYAIQNADLLIIVGSRLDSRQIGGNTDTFSTHSKKIMVDIDENEINKMEEKGIFIDVGIKTDAKAFFNIHTQTATHDYSDWLDTLNLWKVKYKNELARRDDPMVYEYMKTFFNKLPENSIIIPDIGSNLVWTLQSAQLLDTHTLFTNLGNASMGFAIPAAIGAAIATGRPIYVIIGDGGLQMNIQELQTIKTYDLPIHITVLDNGGYGMIKQFQDNYFNSKYCATSKVDLYNGNIDFARIASSYGIKNFDHVKVPENQRIYPKLMFGDSLENMSPYINFENDMIIQVPPKKKQGWN
jgi:acetolactate synthase-1/2/3 large subunit